jgi:hypothetical protein
MKKYIFSFALNFFWYTFVILSIYKQIEKEKKIKRNENYNNIFLYFGNETEVQK